MRSSIRCYLFFVFSALVVGSLSDPTTPVAPGWDDIHVRHAWKVVPTNWESLGPPPVGTTIDLRIALKPHHEEALIDALYEVSSPRHPKYGAHLSKEQVDELVAPHPDTLELVNSWLGHHGVSSTTQGGNWLILMGVPVFQANDILGASFQLYQHAGTNDTVLRTISYALPAALHAHVRTVVPTTYFGSPRAQMHTPHGHRSDDAAEPSTMAGSEEFVTVLSSRDQIRVVDVVPSYLHWLYKTVGYVPAAADENVLGTLGILGDSPDQEDLTIFMTAFSEDGTDATFDVVQLNGNGDDMDNPTVEGNVNIQYAVAMAYPTPNIYYSVGDEWGDGVTSWLHWMLAQESIPQTIVMTYGGYEKGAPLDYATNMCNLFAQLGARGSSVLVASGNSGVGEEAAKDCTTKDSSGNDRLQFSPFFLSTCPWVTVVGGTTSHDPEVAASLSGGGFSNIFPRPRYQDNAVATFLRHLGNHYQGFYNASGRGYPDIAAQALNFVAVYEQGAVNREGTSCATPTVGGIISLLNDYRISKGKPPLGFLNPWLYGSGLAGLNDITSGSNPGCGTDGFPAIVGWDPVTGLGTPDFVSLKGILDKMEGQSLRAPNLIG